MFHQFLAGPHLNIAKLVTKYQKLLLGVVIVAARKELANLLRYALGSIVLYPEQVILDLRWLNC